MDLKRLRQVLAVARTGSFSRAAEELHITQPALSRSIATLEERYGFRIFDRGRGGASLTTTGKRVVVESETLLRSARNLDHNFQLYGSGEAGQIAFGIGPLIASMVLPPLSIHFLHTRPELELRTAVKSADKLCDDLLNDKIELLICAGEQLVGLGDFTSVDVGVIELAHIVRGSHPLRLKHSIKMADVGDYPMLSSTAMSVTSRGGSRGQFICDNYHILRETALSTDAVWISSPQFVADDLRAGELAAIKVVDDVRPSTMNVCLVSRTGCQLSPAALAVEAFVREFFLQLADGKASVD